MDLREIEDYLRHISSELSAYETSTERRDGKARLRMSPVGDPTRWAVIWTPGEDLFGLHVADDFILINPALRPDDEEIKDSLDELLLVAVAYLEGRYRRSGRVFRSLIVETPQGQVVLGRTVGTHVRALLADLVRHRVRTGWR